MQLAVDTQHQPWQHAAGQPTRERLASHREHVLLVEPSNAMWADLAKESLERHGYRVTWMRSAGEAIEALSEPIWSTRSCSAELVLMDIDGPDRDVISFIQLLPALTVRVPPIVLLATQPAHLLMQTAADVGAAGFVCKPFAMDDLLLTVRHSLGRQLPRVRPLSVLGSRASRQN